MRQAHCIGRGYLKLPPRNDPNESTKSPLPHSSPFSSTSLPVVRREKLQPLLKRLT